MHFQSFLLPLSIAALGAAENTVEWDDVPRVCLQVCQFTINLTAWCDRTTDDDDAYRPCVCGTLNARPLIEQCAACVRQNGMRDPDDNDVADLMDDCGWDFNQATASFTSSSSPTQTAPTQTTPVQTTPAQTTPAQTTAVGTSSSSFVASTTSPAGAETGTDDDSSSIPTAAAPITTVGIIPLVAGLIMGLPLLL